MNDNNMKRPPIFGEGLAVKRQRPDAHDKPKNTSSARPDLSAFDGSNDLNGAFRGKPRSSTAAGVARTKEPGLDGPKDISVLHPLSTTPLKQRNAEERGISMIHGPFGQDHPDTVQRRISMTPIRTRPPQFNIESRMLHDKTPIRDPVKQITPRKVTPLRAAPLFQLPSADPSPAEQKLVPLPKFDIVQRPKGKMKAMTDLEFPMVDIQEETEMKGEELEMQRGLVVSPDKGGKKGKRFIRGGLAERARHILARTSTSRTLWRKELESHAPSSRHKLRPDLRVRVQDILQISRISNVHVRVGGALRSVLAVCEVLNPQPPDNEDHDLPLSVNALFSSSSDNFDSDLTGSLSDIVTGSHILIWRPWLEVSLTSLTQEATPISADRSDPPAILCSRFIVLPDTSIL